MTPKRPATLGKGIAVPLPLLQHSSPYLIFSQEASKPLDQFKVKVKGPREDPLNQKILLSTYCLILDISFIGPKTFLTDDNNFISKALKQAKQRTD